MADPTQRIDVRGMACSDAVVKLHQTIMPLKPGATVTVIVHGEDVVSDLRKYAARAGHRWSAQRALGAGIIEAEVVRAD